MRLYLRAVSYFRQDWPLLVLLLSFIGISTAIALLADWPMAILVDSVLATPTKDDWIHRLFLAVLPEHRLGQIIGLAVAGFALKMSGDLLSTAQTIVTNKINYNGLMRVRCDLYRKLQALNLAYHRSQPQGDAIYRLSYDTFGCQTILSVFISTFVATITLLVMIWILGSRHLMLTLLSLSIVPVLAVTNVVFGNRLKARSLECKKVDSEFTTNVQRSMSCIGLVQAFGREADEFGRFRGTVRRTIQAWWRLNWQQISYNLIIGTTFGIGGAMIFGYGGYLVYRNQFVLHSAAGMTIGELMIFLAYLRMVWGPLCSLTGFSANIQGGVAGAQRVFEVLDQDPIIRDVPHARALPRQPRTIELDHVGFTYPTGRPVLRDLCLKIRPGEMVAFVGSSGVGKSTILNLLPRFYDPTAGAVKFDGIDARDIRLRDLRRHVALVLQDSIILPTTIAENIAYGRPSATREQIRLAAHLAGAGQFIEELPTGYETQIAEGGSNLSGGQRQRISIARALLTESPIVVLDEPTSALDPQHEQLVTRSLRALKGSRTIVLVSHRLSTVLDCDQIFVMDHGRIIEQGSHVELLRARGVYYAMAKHQLQLPSDVAAICQAEPAIS